MASYASVTITTTATEILPDNKWRKSAIITNTTSTNVYLGFDNSATTSNGFLLGQEDVWDTNEPRPYVGPVFGIVASGSIDVRYMDLT